MICNIIGHKIKPRTQYISYCVRCGRLSKKRFPYKMLNCPKCRKEAMYHYSDDKYFCIGCQLNVYENKDLGIIKNAH